MKVYSFTIRLNGSGDTPEEAWDDLMDDGVLNLRDGDYSMPDKEDITVIGEDEEVAGD